MGESKAKFSLRLVVDEEKNKVVFAEACRDFVDVLFSLLTLPMGTIVKLLEEHRKERVTIGCFSNIYKSVVDMDTDNFETEACKEMLVNPSSLKEVQCKKLKLNINPTDDDDIHLFACSSQISCKMISDFSTSKCKCGMSMNNRIPFTPAKVVDNKPNEVFVSSRKAFIVTDDLKVEVRSTDLVLQKLKGCGDFSKVADRLIDVGFEEVMTLLQCIFSSDAPLTETFLNKRSLQSVRKACETPSPYTERKSDESEAEPEYAITLSVIMCKHDSSVLYVECGEDFADLLFTFIALPLESVLEISGNSSTFGCLGNLFRSFKDLSDDTEFSTSKSVLPYFYKCKKQLLNIITEQPQPLSRIRDKNPVVLIDPKSHGCNQSTEGSGFAKKNTKFTVTDDLIITPMSSSSTFCLLKKLRIQADDLVVQEISITKTEATSLLGAALVTSSALNTALKNLTLKIPKERSLKKPKKETT